MHPELRWLPLIALVSTLVVLPATLSHAQGATENTLIEAGAPARPFPHFWEQTFGSGHAVLTFRESHRDDLREVRRAADDEFGVYDEEEHGAPVYNFSYVDQIYDGLPANGVRPFLEISFMPKKLALRENLHPFWYKPVVSPPKDYAKWDGLMQAFAEHLVEHSGVSKSGTYPIDFWTGDPKQATNFEPILSLSIQGISPRSQVFVSRVDAIHGNTPFAYKTMGSPPCPTPRQIRELNRKSQPGPPGTVGLKA
jgi:xylan 1,4-beta-xylosidase